MNKKIQIILITYNINIGRCLHSIASQTNQNFDLLILDNGSHDSTVEIINNYLKKNESLKKKTQIIENNANLGFSKAVNIGLKIALKKESIFASLLLNPDAYFKNDLFEKAIKTLEKNPDAGAISSQILYPDKRVWWVGTRILSTKEIIFSNKYSIVEHIDKGEELKYKNDELIELDAITGCALFLKMEAVKKVGLLNEKYFMYAEDIDYSMRLKNAGYKLYLFNNSTVFHEVQDKKMSMKIAIASRKKYNFYLKSVGLYLLDYKPSYVFAMWMIKLPYVLAYNYFLKRAK